MGPYGAGKTTVVRILATLLRPDGGAASVLGHDVAREPDAVRSRVSLTGQFASVDEDMTGRENLVLIARLLGHGWRGARARADELLEGFGLAEAARRQAALGYRPPEGADGVLAGVALLLVFAFGIG